MKKKIAVLNAQVPFFRGGAELHVNALVSNLRKRGFDAELIQIPYKWYPENSLYDSMMAWRMLDLSESNGQKIDMVIGTKFPSYGVHHDNKVVWLIHQFRQVYDLYEGPHGYSIFPEGARIREAVRTYDRKTLLEARAIFANSKTVAKRAKMYNDIDSEPLYHPPALVGRYQSGDYGNYILSVGRLDLLKRNDLLIRAMAKIGHGLTAKIAGTGPEMENLQRLAHQLGVEDRVEFLGFVPDEDLIQLYANAACVYFCPVDEDYGYITLEAFFSRRPVITCVDSGGPLEFVEEGKNGFVCTPHAESVAEAIRKCTENRSRCKEMGDLGFECVEGITWDNVISRLTRTL